MLILFLAYLGGVLTIISPCILPVVPFVFTRADRPFIRGGLPLLAGMALTFTAVASAAAVGGGWVVSANEYGRWIAVAVLGLFGLALLFPQLSDRLAAPAVRLGNRLSSAAPATDGQGRDGVGTSLMLGAATGLLWAPCAGPVLGLILTGAALQGASLRTSLLLLAFGAGAATSLGLAILAGRRVMSAMTRSLDASEWIRRGLGVAVLAAVVAIFFGVDTGVLTRLSLGSTTSIEQRLVNRIPSPGGSRAAGAGGVAGGAGSGTPADAGALRDEGALPPLDGAVEWLNSEPLTREALKGKVVLIDFWTYSCINCLRTIPYVRAWARKYRDEGLVVIGVHSPEFAFEKNVANVRKAIADLRIDYPVAIDNDYEIWRAFENEYWPAHYFVDVRGRIRHYHFGEGEYEQSERVIQQLLAEGGRSAVPDGTVDVVAGGAEAPGSDAAQSPETYIGYARAERFSSPGGAAHDARQTYTGAPLRLNQWALEGVWTVEQEQATLNQAGGRIAYRFHARDLHLVLGAPPGRPVRFRVTVDGRPPAAVHGTDIDANGQGVVNGQRLYQLVRQSGAIADHTFEITFLDAGVDAYAFTFG